jgi:hypothetical protein
MVIFKSSSLCLRFNNVETLVAVTFTKSPAAFERGNEKPKKFKIGIKAAAPPAPPIEKSVERKRVIKKLSK